MADDTSVRSMYRDTLLIIAVAIAVSVGLMSLAAGATAGEIVVLTGIGAVVGLATAWYVLQLLREVHR